MRVLSLWPASGLLKRESIFHQAYVFRITDANQWQAQVLMLLKNLNKELLLLPATGSAIITGKVLAGFITAVTLGVLVLCLGYVLGWTQPEGVYWLSALLVIALVALE